MRFYPGSPFCAEKIMREEDRLRLFEMHSTEILVLDENIRKLQAHQAAQGQRPARGKRILIQRADGFAGQRCLSHSLRELVRFAISSWQLID